MTAPSIKEALEYIANARWNENADLDDICTMADRAIATFQPDGPTDRPIEDIVAGNAFRESIRSRADAMNGAVPLWHGWALMDAFLAGVDYARAQSEDASRKRGE